MSRADREDLLDSLARWPDEPWWIRPDGAISRGEALDRLLITERRLREIGWRHGHRLALEAATDPAAVTLLLAALAAGLDVVLLPLREPPARRRELGAGAQAAAIVEAAGEWLKAPVAPAQQRLERTGGGRIWLRSSGSSGCPRWVVHEAAGLLTTGRLGARALDFAPGSSWRCALPLDHAGGLAVVIRAIVGGGAVVAPDAGARVTHLSLVPTQLARALAAGESVRLRALAALLLGGAPLSPGLRLRAAAEGLPLVVSYGSSESFGMLAMGRDRAVEPDWAGRPLPGWRTEVGPEGELLIAGPGLGAAVASDDGELGPLPRQAGWLATGDLARLDDDGSLFILGRRDNVIISGGEKLSAEELEAALLDLPGVEEVVVVPVPDPEWGQRPGAYVRFAADQERSLATVRDELAATTAAWKLPVALWPLPASQGLKPDRAALARQAAWHRAAYPD